MQTPIKNRLTYRYVKIVAKKELNKFISQNNKLIKYFAVFRKDPFL